MYKHSSPLINTNKYNIISRFNITNPNLPMAGRFPPLPQRVILVRIIAATLLALIIAIGLAVLITWLVVRPRKLIYIVENGSVHGFNLSNNRLDAGFDFVLRAQNPSRRVSVYYDSIALGVAYDDQTIASTSVDPFWQPRRNVTTLEVKPVAKSVALMKSVARDLRLERSSGSVELEVSVRAKVRFKFGMWKSRRRSLKAECEPVLLHFSRSKNFVKVYCDVDI